jgi:hypothetical protein
MNLKIPKNINFQLAELPEIIDLIMRDDFPFENGLKIEFDHVMANFK